MFEIAAATASPKMSTVSLQRGMPKMKDIMSVLPVPLVTSKVADRSMLHNIITKEEMVSADREVARHMTVLRYKMARALCFGHVVDAACDAGYGSWFISLNPDVTHVTGLDIDPGAIEAAAKIYGDSMAPVDFKHGDLNSDDPFRLVIGRVDVLVTAETLEHLQDPFAFLRKAEARGFRRIIATFPSFKTTHFNPHHLHDLQTPDIQARMAESGWVTAAYHSLFGLCDFIAMDKESSPNP